MSQNPNWETQCEKKKTFILIRLLHFSQLPNSALLYEHTELCLKTPQIIWTKLSFNLL